MAECITPFGVRNKMTNQTIAVPCGNCPACRARRTSAWSFRLMQEDKRSLHSIFLTLTYDTVHVPFSPNGFMELKKRDLQLFFKRLRKAHEHLYKSDSNRSAIKYYAVGEYGGRTNRPHYHVLLFNAELRLIDPAWSLGAIHYGTVSEASVGYTMKYMNKPAWHPKHRNDDRQPQFAIMSKGLGDNYINEKMIKWHYADLENRMYCSLTDGKKISMPRYYKDKIYSPEQRKAVGALTRIRMTKDLKEELDRNENYFCEKAVSDKGKIEKFLRNSKKVGKNEL